MFRIKWFPDWRDYSTDRLFCLDLLRGLDIFLLTLLGTFMRSGWFKVFKPSEWSQWFWYHNTSAFASPGSTPTGWGIWDFGQPLFIFICGAAVPFAIPKRLDADGRPTAAFWKHVASRVALLWVLGMFIDHVLAFDCSRFRPYANTLQTIAVAYVGASLSMLIAKRRWRMGISLLTIAVYGMIQEFCGDYSRLGNISRIVDDRVFTTLGFFGKDFCYLLTTPAWMAMGMLGALASTVLLEKTGAWCRAGKLAGWGTASLLFGWVLQLWIPPIRYIYTVSFIFTTLGYATLALAALFVITDIWKFRRGTRVFLLFGQCSLAAWMLSTFFNGAVGSATTRITEGAVKLLGGKTYVPIVQYSVYVALFIVIVSLWYRLRTAECKLAKVGSER